ncbi:MAG: hypothetical protein NTZ67_08120, partial [Gammaproteobacteria bacterium]|nr:hypothetical protein [Gammaproteobacteria bacterium]
MRTIKFCEARISTLMIFFTELKNIPDIEENEKKDIDALIEKIKTLKNNSYSFSDDLIRELSFLKKSSVALPPETNKISEKFTVKLQPSRSNENELSLVFSSSTLLNKNELENNSVLCFFLEMKAELEKNENIDLDRQFKLFYLFLGFIYAEVINYKNSIIDALGKHETTHRDVLGKLSEKIESSSGKLSSMSDIIRKEIMDRPVGPDFFAMTIRPEIGYGKTYEFLSDLMCVIADGRPVSDVQH